ncbi:MAG TPA: hypothetical protein P5150_09735, partial [Candidatus Ratteibacteria bacterium]|nr:hypothetical protein [Candidatus Ratteibacteria bacterium]
EDPTGEPSPSATKFATKHCESDALFGGIGGQAKRRRNKEKIKSLFSRTRFSQRTRSFYLNQNHPLFPLSPQGRGN